MLPRFSTLRVKTRREALEALAESDPAALIAGGTDLLVRMKRGESHSRLIDITPVEELKGVRAEGSRIVIGAGTTHNRISADPLLRKSAISLAEAAAAIGSPQIRNMGTIGGNICHASPAADSVPAFMVYGARCLISNRRGDRLMPLEEVFAGVQKTSLKPGEILTAFHLPPPDPRLRGCYLKFSPRKAMDLPIVGVGVLVRAEDGAFQDVRIALGAVAATPIRARRAEEILRGKPLKEEWIHRAAGEAAKESRPISDLRASAEYRRALVRELTFRAISRSILTEG